MDPRRYAATIVMAACMKLFRQAYKPGPALRTIERRLLQGDIRGPLRRDAALKQCNRLDGGCAEDDIREVLKQRCRPQTAGFLHAAEREMRAVRAILGWDADARQSSGDIALDGGKGGVVSGQA